MADKVAKRGVSIYIDGKQVTNSVKGIRAEMTKLTNEQAKMTIGSDEYVAHAKKIGYLKSLHNEHLASQRAIAAEYKNMNKGVGGFIDRLSDMPGILGTVGQSLQGLGTAFKALIANPAMLALSAIVALGSGVIALVKNSREFSKGMSQLSAITGATGDDLLFLKQKAKDLGAQYGKSAVEIVEAMKMVGSAKPELLANMEALSAVTESVLVLSKATGMDLKDSTSSLTTIMNQFGLSAEEANRTINVLAAGSKFGAVEVDYLGESIVKVGTIAKSAGLSLEQTVAAMELFGEMGVKAEIAGTGFKAILGKLQGDTRNYTNGIFDLNKAIDNNQSISKSNLELQKEFGAEFYGLAGILLQNKDRFAELATQVTNTQTAFEQMRIANDNLEGDTEKLAGTWDKFLLSIEDGDGIFAKGSRAVVKFFTSLVSDLTLFGKDAGNVIEFVKDSFQILGMQIGAIGTTIGESFSMLGTVARKAIEGDFKGISSTFNEFKATVKDAWSPARWQGIIQQQRAMKQLEKNTRDQIKAEKEAKIEALKNKATKTDTGGEGGDGTTPGQPGKPPKKAKVIDQYKIDLDAKEKYFKDEEAINKKAYADEIISEEVYQEWSFQANMDFLNEKLKVQKAHGVDTVDTQIAISDLLIGESKRLAGLEQKHNKDAVKDEKDTGKEKLDAVKQYSDFVEKYGIDELGRFKSQKEAELLILKEYLEKGLLSERDAAKVRAVLASKEFEAKTQNIKDIAGGIANVAGEFSNAAQGFQAAEEQSIENKYKKEIDAAQKAGKDTTAIEAKKNEELAALRAKNADGMFALQVAQIISSTAVSAINAYASALLVPIIGPVLAPIAAGAAVLYGGSQLAQANAAREQAKSGYADGGFTPNVGKYEPTGIVHGGEFVGAMEGVQNPNLRPLYDVINEAQKNGTVGSLSKAQLSKALRTSPGYSDGGYVAPVKTSSGGSSTNNDYTAQLMAGVAQAVERLNGHLDNGITANSVISGRNGSFQQTKNYQSLLNNAKRK